MPDLRKNSVSERWLSNVLPIAAIRFRPVFVVVLGLVLLRLAPVSEGQNALLRLPQAHPCPAVGHRF